MRRKKKVTVKVPAGIDAGQAISVRGQGDMGRNGGPAGDLIVGINIMPHVLFRREGTDIYLEQTVSFLQAALGAQLQIPTLKEEVRWTLPAGTQPGTRFRLRDQGVPVLNGRGRGDQFVTEQRQALERFGETMGESVNPVSAPEPEKSEESAKGGKSEGFFHRKKK